MNTIQKTFNFKKKNNRQISPRFTPTLLSLLVLLLFALIFWWSHVQNTQAKNRIIAGSNADMYVYHLPVREFGYSYLKEGKIPLYNPYTNCGMPFLATYQAALFYPLNFFHVLFSPSTALSLIYLLHIFLAGVFMFFWMRELRISEMGAVFAATAYMLCSFVTYIVVWPHIVLAHVWIPLVFLFIHRTFHRARLLDMILLGAVVGSQFLAGYMQGFIYTLYGAFAYLGFLTLAKFIRNQPQQASLGRSFLLSLLGLSLVPAMLTAIQWIPTAQLSTLSTRPPGGLSLSAILPGGSLYPSMFLAAIANPESYKWVQYTLYPGIIALLLAVFAFSQRKWMGEMLFFAAMGVTASLIAFGTHTPLFKLYLYLPTAAWFRLPNRLLILTAFSIATLAGVGCDHFVHDVLDQPASQSRDYLRFGFFIALSALFILLLPRNAGIYVFIFLIGCLLAFRARSAVPIGMLAAVLVALDLTLYVFNPVTYPWITPAVFPDLPEARQFLREKVGADRVHVFHAKHDWKNYLLNSNFGMVERIRETSGYESLSLQRFAEFCAFMDTGGEPSYELPFTGSVRWSADSLHPRMLNLLGARYIVEDRGRDLYPEKNPPDKMPDSFQLKKILSDTVNIYENPDALPRAFFTTGAEIVFDKHEVLQRLADASFDYRHVLLLEQRPEQPLPAASAQPKGADVVIERGDEDLTRVIVDAPADGFIFLDDMYVPGWRAKVDGHEAKLYRADYLFMAVQVGPGKHVIEVKYLPGGYRAGKWISFVSLVLFVLLFAFDVARRRARSMAPWEAEPKTPTPLPKKPAQPPAAPGRAMRPGPGSLPPAPPRKHT
jgi:hypothetical protein